MFLFEEFSSTYLNISRLILILGFSVNSFEQGSSCTSMFSVFLEDEFERDLIFAFFFVVVFLRFGTLICLFVNGLGDNRCEGDGELGEEGHVDDGAGRLGVSEFLISILCFSNLFGSIVSSLLGFCFAYLGRGFCV